MEFIERYEKMREEEKDTYEKNIKTLHRERPVLEVMHSALAKFQRPGQEAHTPGGGYVSRPFGSGTHQRPSVHFQMHHDDTEATVEAAIATVRQEFHNAGIEIHLTKTDPPEEYYTRWAYDFRATLKNPDVDVLFSLFFWMATNGVCVLVEDGWKDPEKKYKVECTQVPEEVTA